MGSKHFLVSRERLREHQIVTEPRAALADDQAELRIDRFGFTANNVTYGALGDALSYWQFFPEARPGWGRIPVWGFGTVLRSAVDGLSIGERLYGYFPMSSHVVVQPRRVDDAGFLDGTPHRRALHPVYNQYLRTTSDPSYRADTEPYQAVLRPLFATSYFLVDHLLDYDMFGADTVLVTSASSKLAYGTAFVLAGAPDRDRREVIGLTSAHNLDFVTRLGVYDRVVAYGDLAALPSGRRVVVVDIAGDPAVRAAIHHRVGDAVSHEIAVGAAHWDADAAGELAGPRPTLFFAPAWIKRRTEQWTAAEVQRRLAEAWRAFLVPVTDPARGWMTIVVSDGDEAVARTYDDLVAGRGRPDQGHVLSLSQS